MWYLNDFKKAQKEAGNHRYLSELVRVECDCLEGTSRLLDIYHYSRNMKHGDVVYSEANITTQPRSVIPESIGETLFKIACGQK